VVLPLHSNPTSPQRAEAIVQNDAIPCSKLVLRNHDQLVIYFLRSDTLASGFFAEQYPSLESLRQPDAR
jgi:hypothetical protein